MRAKPSKRWVATVTRSEDARRNGSMCQPDAPTWFLARQAAAVLLRADPSDIDVREAKP